MKVIDKTTNTTMEFCNIPIGDVFYYSNSNGIYMKTETLFDEDKYIMANAVNLRLGSLCAFLPEYEVIPLNCECVITDK